MAEIYRSRAGRDAIQQQYRNALDRWPVANRRLTVPTRHGDTFVIESGETSAQPLVLLHGSGTNSSAWLGDVAAWSQRYRVCAIDVIGEPGFSAPSRPPFASDAYAEWLDDVWDRLALTSPSIVAVSLGGWVALDYAIRRPSRVGSLSLISPSGVGRQNSMLLLQLAVLLRLGRWGRERALSRVAGPVMLPTAMREALLLRFRHFRPRLDTLPIRSDKELASLTMPVQLILGGRDELLQSAETRDRMQRAVAQLELTYLENDGHLLPRQTERVAEFLSGAVVRSRCCR